MRSSTVLRVCVVVHWSFAGLAAALSSLLEDRLPAPLRAWLATEVAGGIQPHDTALLMGLIPSLVCALVASIGLLFLKRWAAWLYLASLIMGFIVLPFTGPTVVHALANMVGEIAAILSGSMLGLAFFSDALRARSGSAEQSGSSERPPASR